METIEPKYVTFEQGKLLKQKQFHINCKKIYNTLGDLWDSHYSSMNNNYVDSGATCTAPEQWMVVEWLRVKHNIWIHPFIQFENAIEDECEETLEYGYGIYNFKEMRKMRQNVFPYIHTDEVDNHVFGFDSPEDAYSAAFDYILTKLI